MVTDDKPKKRRRGRGEGGAYQRADGRWVGSVDLGWENGKRKRKVIYGATKSEVTQELQKLHHQIGQGLPIKTKETTLATFLDAWLEDSVKPSVRPRTFDSYRSVVETHLKPSMGKLTLTKLAQGHIIKMMGEKRAEGASERTIGYIRTVLRIALQQAMRMDLVHRNVAALVKPPALKQFEATALDAEQASAFLEQVRSDRLEALYGVALTLGLRQAEAFGLRWRDVDLDRGLLTVRYQLRMVEGEPTWVEPKSRRSRRTVTMPTPLVLMLKSHRSRQLEERLAVGPKWKDHDLIFSTPLGTPLDGSNVRKQFIGHLVTAGLPEIRFHDLRHSAASLLAARGVSQRVVMEILGHTQMSTTNNIYTHITTASMKDATDLLSDLFEADKASS